MMATQPRRNFTTHQVLEGREFISQLLKRESYDSFKCGLNLCYSSIQRTTGSIQLAKMSCA